MEWTSDLIKITDFVTDRNVDRNAATQYIRRHPELFEGHTVVYRKALYCDDVAITHLEKKYPFQSTAPVEIIRDPEVDELRRQVIALQDALIEAQKKMQDLTEQASLAEARKILIEDKSKQIDEQKEKISELEKERDEAKVKSLLSETECLKLTDQVEEESKKRAMAEEKLEEVRKMNILQRILWKG